jgi:antitoxin HicB
MSKFKYQMLIQWSSEDNCFLVGFADFPGQPFRTHGGTYQEAVANSAEALESLIMAYEATGEALPEPTVLMVA